MKSNSENCDGHNKSRILLIRVLSIAIKLANLDCPEHIHDELMKNINSLLRSIDEHKENIVPNLCNYVFAFSKSIKDLNMDIQFINYAADRIQKLAFDFDIEEIQNEYELYIKITY